MRSIRVKLNRPNFTLNPTNCDPFSVTAEIVGNQGAVAHPSEHYQVANCGTLPFAPKLTMGFSGSTKHAGDPALHTDPHRQCRPKPISPQSRSPYPTPSSSTTPISRAPCTRVQYDAQQCPPGSVIGFAKAETPLLEKPLEGPVYLRAGGGRPKTP